VDGQESDNQQEIHQSYYTVNLPLIRNEKLC